eukprot:gene25370-biopygen4497
MFTMVQEMHKMKVLVRRLPTKQGILGERKKWAVTGNGGNMFVFYGGGGDGRGHMFLEGVTYLAGRGRSDAEGGHLAAKKPVSEPVGTPSGSDMAPWRHPQEVVFDRTDEESHSRVLIFDRASRGTDLAWSGHRRV